MKICLENQFLVFFLSGHSRQVLLYMYLHVIFQLALKHRQGRNHKMRIVVFVGSPIEDDEKEVCLELYLTVTSVQVILTT